MPEENIIYDPIFTRGTCPKDDTWFANGGRCGWAHECGKCTETPDPCSPPRLTREKAREDKRWNDEFVSQDGPYRIRKYVREEE